jgi:hypothetical protein
LFAKATRTAFALANAYAHVAKIGVGRRAFNPKFQRSASGASFARRSRKARFERRYLFFQSVHSVRR